MDGREGRVSGEAGALASGRIRILLGVSVLPVIE